MNKRLLQRLWRTLFGPKVCPGQKWEFDPKNPFGDTWVVEVLEVRDSYVRYRSVNGRLIGSGTDRIDDFRYCYKPCEE